MNSPFNAAKDAADKIWIMYRPVRFPLTWYGDGIEFAPVPGHILSRKEGFRGKLTRDGFNYLIQRLGEFVDKDKARELIGRSPVEFVEYINKCRQWQEQVKADKEKDRVFVVALENDTHIVGLLTAYNPYSHSDVLSLVEQEGVQSDLSSYSITPKTMTLYFKQSIIGDWEYGLAIKNGMTGHVAFGYHFYVRNGKYAYTSAVKDKRRHMSHLNEAVSGMSKALADAKEIDAHNYMANTNAATLANQLASEYTKLEYEILGVGHLKLIDLAQLLTRYTSYKGYKTIAKAALDKLFKEIYANVG